MTKDVIIIISFKDELNHSDVILNVSKPGNEANMLKETNGITFCFKERDFFRKDLEEYLISYNKDNSFQFVYNIPMKDIKNITITNK